MTELGIPVFNTPGANANAVKELVLCGLFLGSRRLVDGINHMKQLGEEGLEKERVEKDKAMFLSWNLPFYPYPIFQEILTLYPRYPVNYPYLPGKFGGNDFTRPYPNLG